MYVYMYTYVCVSEKAMAPHSSTLAWKISWTEEPGRLQSMGLQGGTRLSNFTHSLTCTHTQKESVYDAELLL